jgi:Flp pilus assembly protein TadG
MTMNLRNRRGNASIFALALFPLLGFASLSTDIGLQRMSETELQVATEAAVLSGAGYLDGTTTGLSNAINGAVTVGNLNMVYGSFAVESSDVELGVWDGITWTAVTTTAADPQVVNSLRVTTAHDHDAILARFLLGGAADGSNQTTTTLGIDATATAMRPAGGTARTMPCYLPFAIPACVFEGTDWQNGEQPDHMEFVLNRSGDDNVGWGLPLINPNSNAIRSQIEGQCDADAASTGDTVNLSNGQNQTAISLIADIINQDEPTEPTAWPYDVFSRTPNRNGQQAHKKQNSDIEDAFWGNNVAGVVPIIDMGYFDGTGVCGDMSFNAEADIVGWTYVYIYDTGKSNVKSTWMQFDFQTDYNLGYGYDPDAIGNISGTMPATMIE